MSDSNDVRFLLTIQETGSLVAAARKLGLSPPAVTQRLQQIAISTQGDAALSARLSVNGALILYLDFINLFRFLLYFVGGRR